MSPICGFAFLFLNVVLRFLLLMWFCVSFFEEYYIKQWQGSLTTVPLFTIAIRIRFHFLYSLHFLLTWDKNRKEMYFLTEEWRKKVGIIQLLHNNVEKKVHKNLMPLLTHENAWKRMKTHENACIIYHGSNMAPCVYSRVLMGYTSSLFAGLQVRWYYIVDFIVDFQWVFVGNQCRAGNFTNRRSGV